MSLMQNHEQEKLIKKAYLSFLFSSTFPIVAFFLSFVAPISLVTLLFIPLIILIGLIFFISGLIGIFYSVKSKDSVLIFLSVFFLIILYCLYPIEQHFVQIAVFGTVYFVITALLSIFFFTNKGSYFAIHFHLNGKKFYIIGGLAAIAILYKFVENQYTSYRLDPHYNFVYTTLGCVDSVMPKLFPHKPSTEYLHCYKCTCDDPEIYLYDFKSYTSKRITVEQAISLNLIDTPISPDNNQVIYCPGSNIESNICLQKGNLKKNLHIKNKNDFIFIGWIPVKY